MGVTKISDMRACRESVSQHLEKMHHLIETVSRTYRRGLHRFQMALEIILPVPKSPQISTSIV